MKLQELKWKKAQSINISNKSFIHKELPTHSIQYKH